MISEIPVDRFKHCFLGHNITDCCVRNRGFFYFTTREDYSSWPEEKWDRANDPPPDDVDLVQHIIIFNRDSADPAKRWSRASLRGWKSLKAGAVLKPQQKFVGVNLTGKVYSLGSGSMGEEAEILHWKEGGARRGSVNKLRTIDGWLYFCGGNNSVGQRVDADRWVSHTANIPDPDRRDNLFNRFLDIDGFDAGDIFCVGNDGQLFHHDGKSWGRVAFPTNADLETVCCAGDGKVYISDAKGSVYKGRGEEWKQIHKGSLSLPWRDMVWYDGRLWCTSDYGVWTITKDKVEKAALPPGIAVNAGNLSAADGVLLLAGYGGAAFLEDGQWTTLYNAAEMHDLVRKQQREGGSG